MRNINTFVYAGMLATSMHLAGCTNQPSHGGKQTVHFAYAIKGPPRAGVSATSASGSSTSPNGDPLLKVVTNDRHLRNDIEWRILPSGTWRNALPPLTAGTLGINPVAIELAPLEQPTVTVEFRSGNQSPITFDRETQTVSLVTDTVSRIFLDVK